MRRLNSKKRKSGNYFNCGISDHFSRDYKEKKEDQILENYEVLYKKPLDHIKKERISLPKAFIETQEEFKEWVKEEVTSEEEEGLNIKGVMVLINDTLDGGSNKCDADTFQVVQESNMKIWNVSSTHQDLEHT